MNMQQNVPNSDPATDPAQDPNYVAQMVARADGTEQQTQQTQGQTEQQQQQQQQQQQERPEWLPEKFKSPEELARAYNELQQRLGQQGNQQGNQQAQEEADEAAQKAVQQAGLDMAKLEAEVIETGTLSEDSFKALEKAGITRDMVNSYIEGQRAIGEAVQQRITEYVGGEEVLNSMLSWASTNLNVDEIEAFNSMVSGSEAQARIAFDGLKAKYEAANGRAPKALVGGGTPAGGGAGYSSIAEMQREMSDPRYATDPAFREQVAAKLARSSIF